MSITAADLKLYKSANTPTNDSGISGGAISVTEILGSIIGELIPQCAYNAAAGGDIVWYYKAFFKNTHATLPLTESVVYIKNALISLASNGTVSAVSTSSSDGSSKKIKVYGEDASGTAVTEEVILNGTTTATGSQVFSKIYKIELLTLAGALTTATGTITITRGITLGIIPVGFSTATNEYSLWLAATLNDTASVANRLTAPAGASWSIPNSYATGLAVANSQSLTAGSAQGIWIRATYADGTSPTSQMELILRLEGNTT